MASYMNQKITVADRSSFQALNCTIKTNQSIVDGAGSVIIGNDNTITGAGMKAYGDRVRMDGVGCIAYGRDCVVSGVGSTSVLMAVAVGGSAAAAASPSPPTRTSSAPVHDGGGDLVKRGAGVQKKTADVKAKREALRLEAERRAQRRNASADDMKKSLQADEAYARSLAADIPEGSHRPAAAAAAAPVSVSAASTARNSFTNGGNTRATAAPAKIKGFHFGYDNVQIGGLCFTPSSRFTSVNMMGCTNLSSEFMQEAAKLPDGEYTMTPGGGAITINSNQLVCAGVTWGPGRRITPRFAAAAPAPAPVVKKPNTKSLVPEAWPDEPAEKVDGETECAVCEERGAHTIVKPCNHVCMCVACARAFMNGNNSSSSSGGAAAPVAKECPKCRATIKRIERMYV